MARWYDQRLKREAEENRRQVQQDLDNLLGSLSLDAEQISSSLSSLSYQPINEVYDVSIEWHSEPIDVSTSGGYTFTIPGRTVITVRDQDGREVPEDLKRQIIDLMENHSDGDEQGFQRRLKEVLNDYNRPLSLPLKGHRDGCIYRGGPGFSCTCQPPTIYGKTHRYHCSCCELPRALRNEGLCEICKRHQYSDSRDVDEDHRYLLLTKHDP